MSEDPLEPLELPKLVEDPKDFDKPKSLMGRVSGIDECLVSIKLGQVSLWHPALVIR